MDLSKIEYIWWDIDDLRKNGFMSALAAMRDGYVGVVFENGKPELTLRPKVKDAEGKTVKGERLGTYNEGHTCPPDCC